MKPYKRIRVFTETDVELTAVELAIIDCRSFQRLRSISQLGQSSAVFPTAEHSRFGHALGALSWTAAILRHLTTNHFSAEFNVQRLRDAEKAARRTFLSSVVEEEPSGLGFGWYEQYIRLAALLHDISHIPFGHTLEDQAGVLTPRHDENAKRLFALFDKLKEEVKDSPHLLKYPSLMPAVQELLSLLPFQHWVDILIERRGKGPPDAAMACQWGKYGDLPKTDDPSLPARTLVSDIVNNTICADLLDYLHRDSLFSCMPWAVDSALLTHLKVLEVPSPLPGVPSEYRLGIAVARNGRFRHDVVTAVLGLLRARYDITEKVYYHHAKCAADAMLEKCLRASGMTLSDDLFVEKLLGDEGFLNYLEQALEDREDAARILGALRSRRFYKPVYSLKKGPHWSPQTRTRDDLCRSAAGRTELENDLCGCCGVDQGSIIVARHPDRMQMKAAAALVEWTDGEVLRLEELPRRKHYLKEVTALTERYLDLWSLNVYLDPKWSEYALVVMTKCEELFEHQNEPIVRKYVEKRFDLAHRAHQHVKSIAWDAEAEIAPGLQTANQAAMDDQDIEKLAAAKLSAAAERRQRRSSKPRAEREARAVKDAEGVVEPRQRSIED